MLAIPEIALAWQIPVCYERAMSRKKLLVQRLLF